MSSPSSSGAASRSLGPATALAYRGSGTLLTGHKNGAITRIVSESNSASASDKAAASYSISEFRSAAHKTPIRSILAHGHTVVTISQDKAVVWSDNGTSLSVARTMSGDFRAGVIVQSGSSSSSSTQLALLFADSSLAFYDLDCFALARQYVLPVTEGAASLLCVCASPTVPFLITAGANAMLYLYDTNSNVLVCIAEMPPAATSVLSLAYAATDSATGTTPLVVLGDDGRILVLDYTPKQCTVLYEIAVPNEAITSFALDRAGKYLTATTSTGTLKLYDLKVALDTASQVKDARKRMGMAPDQVTMALHTRTPLASSRGDFPKPPPETMWSSHANPDGLGGDAAGTVTSDLIENVFGRANNTYSSAKKSSKGASTSKQSVLSKSTTDYSKLNPGHAKNANRWEPLYRLARLDPKETRLNTRKLRTLLDSYGEYPQKYRLLCWRFLLELPENHDAFALLANKEIHVAFSGLNDRYPLKNQRVFKKLQAVLSALAYWSPVFGEAEFVPALAYPFVSLFQVDDLAAFETVMAVLLHWGGTWLTTFPHPPIPVLNTVEQIIHSHDPALMKHLVAAGVSSQTYAWAMLRSAFTEVLNKSEWLRLWDHLFTNAHDPALILCAVAAYTIYNRNALMPAKDKKELEPFWHRQNPINMSDFILLMYELRRKTPSSTLPRPGDGSLEDDERITPKGKSKGSKSAQEADDNANVLSSVLSSPDTPWPLPRGMYPAFHGYPKFVVDFQIAERARLAAEDSEVRRKRRLLEALGERAKGLATEEEQWQASQQILMQAEETRRRSAEEAEQKRLEEERRLDDISRERRLAQIEAMEEAARAAMQNSAHLRSAETKRIDDDMIRIRQKAEYTIKQRMEEEALLNLENQASQRVRSLQITRTEEERGRELRAELKAKEDKMALDDRLLMDRLKVEDEERRLQADIERAKREKLAQMDASMKTQQEINEKFVATAAEREAKLAEVERERRLRHLAEDEGRRKAEEISMIEKMAEVEKKAEIADMEQLILDARSWRQSQAKERMNMIEEERRRYILESEVREKRLEELTKLGRRREYEKSMIDVQQEEVSKTLEEEKAMQQALLTMEQDRVRDRLHELRLQLQEEERKNKAEFQQALQGAEERIVAEERRRFIQIREELRGRAAEQEREIAAEHERRMSAMQAEQKQEMDRIKEMIRKKVQLQEASTVATKYDQSGSGGGGKGEAGAGEDSVLERAKATLARQGK
jgi:hypothetical protein